MTIKATLNQHLSSLRYTVYCAWTVHSVNRFNGLLPAGNKSQIIVNINYLGTNYSPLVHVFMCHSDKH